MADHSQELAGPWVENDDRPFLAAQRFFRRQLQVKINGQLDVGAWQRLGRLEQARRRAESVDLYLLAAVDAADQPVIYFFHAVLAEAVPQAIAFTFKARQLSRLDLADITEQMRGHATKRIIADRDDADDHAFQLAFLLLDPDGGGRRNIIPDNDRPPGRDLDLDLLP